MPFIGQQPQTGAYHKLDSITTSATATYNLQLNGGAYYPTSANHLLVSLNGVMQAPQDSFTVSGSQITFASALTSSDSIDFIMALGDVLDIGVPSDGAVNTSQLANSAVTDAKIASGISSSKLTGALPALDGSALTGIAFAAGDVYVAAQQSGDQTITRAADVQLTNLIANEIDSDNAWDGSSFTVPSGKGGIYLAFIQAAAYFGNIGVDGEYADCRWRKNGVATGVNTRGISMASGHRALNEFAVQNLNLLELSAGDVLTAYVNFADDNGGTAITNSSNTHIWILRIT